MRRIPGLIAAGTDGAVSITSQPVSIGDNVNFFIMVLFGGGGGDLAGSLSLQCSDDPTSGDWITIANSTQAVTASADHAWNVSDAHYPYARVVWTYTSGTGTIAARCIISEQIITRGG